MRMAMCILPRHAVNKLNMNRTTVYHCSLLLFVQIYDGGSIYFHDLDTDCFNTVLTMSHGTGILVTDILRRILTICLLSTQSPLSPLPHDLPPSRGLLPPCRQQGGVTLPCILITRSPLLTWANCPSAIPPSSPPLARQLASQNNGQGGTKRYT